MYTANKFSKEEVFRTPAKLEEKKDLVSGFTLAMWSRRDWNIDVPSQDSALIANREGRRILFDERGELV